MMFGLHFSIYIYQQGVHVPETGNTTDSVEAMDRGEDDEVDEPLPDDDVCEKLSIR